MGLAAASSFFIIIMNVTVSVLGVAYCLHKCYLNILFSPREAGARARCQPRHVSRVRLSP